MYLQDIGEECKNDAFYGGVTTKIYEQNVKKNIEPETLEDTIQSLREINLMDYYERRH